MTKKESNKIVTHMIADLTVAEYDYNKGEISLETFLYMFSRYCVMVSLYHRTNNYEEFHAHPLIKKLHELKNNS